jgi:ABC-type sugar transport system permease subunit
MKTVKTINVKEKVFKNKKLIFYIVMMALPVIQFSLMYVGVNLNSILLAFKKYDIETGRYAFIGFQNFVEVFEKISSEPFLKYTIPNSILIFALNLVIILPMSLIFAYYLTKKYPLSGFLQIILYLPSIISSIVMVTMYMHFAESTLPSLIFQLSGGVGDKPEGFISNPDTTKNALLIYLLFFGFGATTMIFTNSMSSINPSIMEASRIDGCGHFRQFIHMVLPLCFNIIKLQIISIIIGIFTNQFNLYTFFGTEASGRLHTIGYYLYKETLIGGLQRYPYLSAFGLVITIVAIPIVFSFRAIADKIDPNA